MVRASWPAVWLSLFVVACGGGSTDVPPGVVMDAASSSGSNDDATVPGEVAGVDVNTSGARQDAVADRSDGSPAGADTANDRAPARDVTSCIMPLGDSITQADVEHMSYRYWLWQQLSAAGYSFGFVGSTRERHARTANEPVVAYPDRAFDPDHEGHWGQTPAQILSLLNGIPNWNKQIPGVVLLHAGTNEVWGATGEPADAIARRATGDIGKIIDLLRSKNPRVVILLAQVIPLDSNRYFAPFQDAIKAINVQVAALAAAKSSAASPVQVVDQWTGFLDADFLPDGIHPNETGEKKLAAGWFRALKPLFDRGDLAPCPL